jgi:hypothetical protein
VAKTLLLTPFSLLFSIYPTGMGLWVYLLFTVIFD